MGADHGTHGGVFHGGKRVAVHVRSSSNRKHTTVREHMPSSHRRYADWTPERIQGRANEIGPKTSALIEIILRERTHPEQGFRATIGILRHAKSFGHERLEAACGRALEIGARSYTSVTSILKTNLDRQRPALRHGRAGDRAREHPWPPLLPLRRQHAMLTHPTIDQLRALKLDGMAEAFVELQSQDTAGISRPPNGWRCCSIARRRIAAPSASRAGCATRSCATARRQSRTSTTVPPDGSTRRCSSNSPPAAGSPSIAICSSPGRAASASRGSVCALAQRACRDGYTVHYARVPRLFADLELAHGDGRFARLFRTLTKADLLILNDWGPDRLSANQRRDLMEIVEDRYGAGLDADHQPAAGRRVARGHRRADFRRRHPRSPRAQRLPSRARRPIDARSQDGQVGYHSAGAERDGYDGHETADRSKK